MRRRHTVVFAIVFAILLPATPITGGVAAASTKLVVGSSHDTQQEFSNAQTLENLTATDTGDGAVELDRTASKADGFDDGNVAGWTMQTGDTWTHDTATTYQGSGAAIYQVSSTGWGNAVTFNNASIGSQNITVSVWVQEDSGDDEHPWIALRNTSTDNQYVIDLSSKIDELTIRKGTGTVLNEAAQSFSYDSWYQVVVEYDPSADTIEATAYDTSGNKLVSLGAAGSGLSPNAIGVGAYRNSPHFDELKVKYGSLSSARYLSEVHNIDNPEQAAINVTALSNVSINATIQTASGTTLATDTFTTAANHTLNLSSTSSSKIETVLDVDVTGSNPQFTLADESILFTDHAPIEDTGTVCAGTCEHYWEPQDGTSFNSENVTLKGTIDDQEFGTAQGESVTVEAYLDGQKVGEKTISSAGSVKFSVRNLADGKHEWYYVMTDSYGLSTTSEKRSFTINHYAPAAANPSPADGYNATTENITFDVDVADGDFAVGEDSVTAALYLKGPSDSSYSKIYSETVTSNTTVSTTHTVTDGGKNKWYWKLTDTYAGTANTTTPKRSVFVPDTLYIRNVSDPSQLVDNATVEVRFLRAGNDTVISRTTTDGTISLTGLPVGEPFVVIADTDGYVTRRTTFEHVYEQQTVYLLPDSKPAVRVDFVLNDQTGGQFPAATTRLLIKRPVTLNNSTTFRIVASDYFGATGEFSTLIQPGQRYRLAVVNSGSYRGLGGYVTQGAETATLNVGSVQWTVKDIDTIRAQARWINLTDGNERPNGVVSFQYVDPNNRTATVDMTIRAANNSSHVLVEKTFNDGPYGTISYNQSVVGAENVSTDWVVDWQAYNESGGKIASASEQALGKQYLVANPFGSKFAPVMVAISFVFVASLFGGRLSGVGSLAVVGIAGIFWWIGWYTAGAGVVLFAGGVAVLFAMRGGGR